MKNWFNVELNERDAVKMKEFLTEKGIKFDTSGCFELVHFEIFLEKDSEDYKAVNNKLDAFGKIRFVRHEIPAG